MDDLKLANVEGKKYRNTGIRPRHRLVYAELQKPENKGLMNKALAAAGYPLSMQDKPSQITDTKSWRAILDEHLPEDLLALRHNELLNKRDGIYVTQGHGKNRTQIFLDRGPDTTAVKGALEMGYKLRGKFVSEPPPTPLPTNVYNLFYSPQVRESVTAFEDSLKHAIAHEIARTPEIESAPTDSAADTYDGREAADSGSVEDAS